MFRLLLAVAFSVLVPSAAHALIVYDDFCGGGFNYDPQSCTQFSVDYTVPTGGSEVKWTFWVDNDDPTTQLSLSPPNQVDYYHFFRLPSGELESELVGVDKPYKFEPSLEAGFLTVRARGPKAWNVCDDVSVVGLCGVQYDIFGNAAVLSISSGSPGPLRWSVTTVNVPEPATWALLILGLGATGAMLRRRRGSATDRLTSV